MSTKNIPKALVIIGPTASGKSDLALTFAQEKNGEVISVDSRQIYRGMDIGTGKITQEEQSLVPHHLLDICEPGEAYNVSHFIQDAKQREADIRNREKLPIFCGGTLFWMEAYLQNSPLPPVPPNPALRAELAKKDVDELFSELQRLDPERADTVDAKNKVRLIRALEIVKELGSVPKLQAPANWQENYELIILTPEVDVLKERIKSRLTIRFKQGMIAEVEGLLKKGVSHEWLQAIGLEYKYISLFLQGKLSQAEMEEQLFHAIWHYAKRQITYLKKFTTTR